MSLLARSAPSPNAACKRRVAKSKTKNCLQKYRETTMSDMSNFNRGNEGGFRPAEPRNVQADLKEKARMMGNDLKNKAGELGDNLSQAAKEKATNLGHA